jgi:hypothetical protein
MRILLALFLISSSFATSSFSAPARAMQPGAAASRTMDGEARREIVAKLSNALRDNYVFTDIGQKAAEKITASLAAGEYDSLADPNTFAARLSFTPRSTPRPGSELAARQLVAGLLSGKPDYTIMTAEYADLIRTQLPELQGLLLPLGELRAMKFRQVGMMGGDQYEVSFTKGAVIIAILLDLSGKLFGAQIMPPSARQ